MGESKRAVIGIRVKSGWGAVVVLAGTHAAPRLILSSRLELSDPADPFGRICFVTTPGDALAKPLQTMVPAGDSTPRWWSVTMDATVASPGDDRHHPVAYGLTPLDTTPNFVIPQLV